VSRVQCLECGIAVVVDPTGVCPEGHLVGGTGVRVAGAMGTDTQHPDEPEPWVATVVLDEADAAPVVRERTIRPVRLAGADETTGSVNDEAADHESMLRELHALGDIHDLSPGPTPARSLRPDRDLSPDPAATDAPGSAPVPHSPPPPQEQVAEGFAELSALEAAFHALGYDEDAPRQGEQPTGPPPTSASPATSGPTGTAPRDDLADVEGLFAAQGAHRSESTVARGPNAPGPDPAAAQAPGRTGTPASSPNASPAAPRGDSAPTPAADREPMPAHASAPPAASAASLPAAPLASPDVPPPPAATVEEPTPDHADAASRANQVDITNFTAHGGKVGAGRGGRRRRFGR